MDLREELMQKLYEEQAAYKDQLCTLPAQEILDRAYEINLRDDILSVMNSAYLTDQQMEKLLSSPTPLADIIRAMDRREPGHTESIRERIRNSATVLLKQEKPKMSEIPIYMGSPSYALQHEETEQYKASYQANVACMEAIENSIAKHYHDNRLDISCVNEVVEEFGLKRTQLVLASTIQSATYDGRISEKNKKWAQKVPLPDEIGRGYHVNGCHRGLVDLFTQEVRKFGQKIHVKKQEHEVR